MKQPGVYPFDAIDRSLRERIREKLKHLLESKHLYQSVMVDYIDLVHAQVKEQGGTIREKDHERYKSVVGVDRWSLSGHRSTHYGIGPSACFEVTIPDVKLFCTSCDRVEPFNSISAWDLTAGSDPVEGLQIFGLSYQCQSCKGAAEVFLIRRERARLTLSGRSPIENVTVPAAVPKSVKRFYSGALVAHQSGQTLAGMFLLRTLLEQFARASTKLSEGFADQVIEAYMAGLPAAFRGQFPSVRELYGELSADIHAATGSPELFAVAVRKINQHFEARRIFELPTTEP